MTAVELIKTLDDMGVHVSEKDGQLYFSGKVKRVTSENRAAIVHMKPELLVLAKNRDDPMEKGFFYWSYGKFYGPGIGTYAVGICKTCEWNAPLMKTGSCVLCEQAESRNYESRLCDDDCPEPIVGRYEPGGVLSCKSCRDRLRKVVRESEEVARR